MGERLKEARTLRKFSQDDLSKKIGVSRGVITNIEYNKIEAPQPIVIKSICDALNIRQEWLLYGTGDFEPNSETTKSARVLSEIYNSVQELSEEEQLYILEMVKTYKKHIQAREESPSE